MYIHQFKNKIIGYGIAMVFALLFALSLCLFAVLKIKEADRGAAFAMAFSDAITQSETISKSFFYDIYVEHHPSDSQFVYATYDKINKLIATYESIPELMIYRNSVLQIVSQIKQNMLQINTKCTQRGFKDSGIEGEMRKKIHILENNVSKENKILLLTLRRHEKDFFLRKDLSYVTKFKSTANELQQKLSENELKNILISYQTDFNKIVYIEKTLGFNKNLGLQAKINDNFLQLNQTANKMLAKSNKDIHDSWQYIVASLFVFALIVLVLIFLFIKSVFYFKNQIIKPSIALSKVSNELANGNLEVKFEKNKNENILSNINDNFELLLFNYQKIFTTIHQIIENENIPKLTLRSQNDGVNTNLNHLIEVFKTQKQIESERKWFDEGQNKITEILYNIESHETMAQTLISFIVQYLKANQAAIFIKNFDCNHVEFVQKATYAYQRKKYANKTIQLYEDLVGQCAAEKQTIVLKKVPDDYIKITSGLGNTSPSQVVIVPFLNNSEVIAVLEICSLEPITELQILFLETIGKNIASSFLQHQFITNSQNLLNKANIDVLQLANAKLEIDDLKNKHQIEIENLREINLATTQKLERLTSANNLKQQDQDNFFLAISNKELRSIGHQKADSNASQKHYPRKIEYYLDA